MYFPRDGRDAAFAYLKCLPMLKEKTTAKIYLCGRPLYLIVNEHDALPLKPLGALWPRSGFQHAPISNVTKKECQICVDS